MKVSRTWLQTYIAEPLPNDDAIVAAFTDYAFEVEDVSFVEGDSIFDVKVLPNRAHDCLSHRGVARELATILGLTLTAEGEYQRTDTLPTSSKVSVVIDDAKACRRYCGVLIEGVGAGESPAWIVEYLSRVGQRSINPVVDIANYVMLALGQPMHAFDVDKMSGPSVRVRFAKDGEAITTLTGEEKTLASDMLVIADGGTDACLGIAGVKGGMIAAVDSSTTRILLEAANFAPSVVRRSSRRLQLITDAAKRFENELSAEYAREAIVLCAKMITENCGGTVEGIVDEYPRPERLYKVGVSGDKIRSVLGATIDDATIGSILAKRGLSYEVVEPRDRIIALLGTVTGAPYKRGASVLFDAPALFDCSSLSAWLYKEAGLAIPRMSVDQYAFCDSITADQLRAGDLIFANTGDETTPGSIYYETKEWMPGTKVPQGVDHVGIYVGDGLVAHATSSVGSVVREELASSKRFSSVVGYGRVPGVDAPRFVATIPVERIDIRIEADLVEEVGQLYGYANLEPKQPTMSLVAPYGASQTYAKAIREALMTAGFDEVSTYAFRQAGVVEVANPLASDKAFLRADLSSGMADVLEQNLRHIDLLGVPTIAAFEIGSAFTADGERTMLSVGARDTSKKQVAAKAALERARIALAALGIQITPDERGIAEVNLTDIIPSLPPMVVEPSFTRTDVAKYVAIPPYPTMVRDVALFAPSEGLERVIADVITESAGELLKTLRLFDVFAKKDGEVTQVSYAFRLVLQADDRTLTDADADAVMARVVAALTEREWQVR